MTTKTKYLVIALLLLVLVTTSVGLSTWNIHYQAVIGDIAYDTSTKSSILNNYVYFGATDDEDRAQANIQQNGSALYTYPIGYNTNSDGSVVFDGENYSTKTDNLFTYTYQSGKEYSPSVFVPSETAIKGDLNHPTKLFLDDSALDIDWGIEDVFDEIKWEYQYRLASVPFDTSYLEEDYKGNSDNYCEVNAVYYAENQITVYLSWKNGKGNHQGDGIRVDFVVDENGNESFTIRDKNNNELTAQEAKLELDSTADFITIGVKGFRTYQFVRENCGWTTDIPTETGVWECRIIAKADKYEYIINKDANLRTDDEKSLVEAIDLLNSNTENDVDYATQVTYAVMPAPVSKQNTVTDYNGGTEKLQAKRSGTTRGTMPLAEENQQTQTPDKQEFDLTDNNGNIIMSGTSFVYKGQGYNIEITADFQPTEGAATISINYAEEQEKDAQDIVSHDEINASHVHSTYGFSSDPNYIVTDPAVHYTIIKQEVKLTGWSGLETTYNGEEQKVEPILENTHGEVTFFVSYQYQFSGGDVAKNAGIYTVTAELVDAVKDSGLSANYFLVNYYEEAGKAFSSTDFSATMTINKAPLTVTANNHEITYGDAFAHNGVTYGVKDGQEIKNGFIGTDNATNSLAGTLSIVSTTKGEIPGYDQSAAETRKVGDYTLIASGYEDVDDESGKPIYADDGKHNYTFTYVDGILTVKQLVAKFDWSNLDPTYNGTAQKPVATVTNEPYDDDVSILVTGEKTNANVHVNTLGNMATNNDGSFVLNTNGQYTATADELTGAQAGNYTLEGASGITQDFVIKPMSISGATITLGAALTYNGKEQTRGFTTEIALAESTPKLAESTDYLVAGHKATNAFTYELTITGQGNYYQTKTSDWEILKKDLTVKADNVDVIYGGEITYTATYDGFVKDEGVGNLAGKIAYNSGYVLFDDISNWDDTGNKGVYTIVASGYEDKDENGNTIYVNDGKHNYTFTYVEGTLTVEKATITDISVVGYTGTYDGAQHDSTTKKSADTVNDQTLNWTLGIDKVRNVAHSGTYNYTVTADNHYDATGTFTVSITPKPVAQPTADNREFVYNGTEQTYELATNDDYTISNNKQINANSYKVIVALKDKDNFIWQANNNTNDLSFTFTISPASVKVVVDDQEITYGDAAPKYTVSYTGLFGSDSLGTTASCDYTKGNDAGTYEITLSENTNGNYVISNDSKTTATLTVKKAPNSITSLAIAGWTYGEYDATKNAPSATAQFGESFTFEYSSDGTNFSNTVPANAGTYTLKATVAETTNYESAEATTTFTIAKATVITPTIPSQEFTGEQLTPAISNTNLYTVTIPADAIYQVVGTYYITVTLEDSDNYKWSTDENSATVTVTFEITKANAVISDLTIEGWTYGEYDETKNAPSATSNFAIDFFYYKKADADDSTYTTAVPSNAGTYVVKAIITDSYNVTGTSKTATFTIAKAEVTSPAENTTKFEYTAEEQTYALTENDLYTISNNKRTIAGSQTVTVSLNDKGNYQWDNGTSDDLTFTFTIAKATVGTPANQSTEYTGTTLTANLTDTTIYTVTTNAGGVDVGDYDVVLTLRDSSNYKWSTSDSATVTIKFSITQATTVISGLTITGWTYGQTAKEPSATTNFGTIVYTYYNSDGTKLDSAPTNAGTYHIKATVAGTTNYTATSAGPVEFTIAQATTVISGLTITDWTYGEAASTPSATTNFGTIKYWYKLTTAADSTYTETVPTNAGNYTVKAEVVGNNNYTSDTETATFIISPKPVNKPVITDNTKVFTYNGTNQQEAILGNITYDKTAMTAGGTASTYTDAGDKDITFTLVNNNYCWKDGTTATTAKVSITINKATPTVEIKLSNTTPIHGEIITISATITGVTGETISGTLSLDPTTITASFTGTSPSVSREVTVNYTFTPVVTNYNYESTKGTKTLQYTVNAVAYIDSTYYGTVEAALEAAVSGKTVYVIPGTNPTIKTNATIKSGVTLCLPYEGTLWGSQTSEVQGGSAKYATQHAFGNATLLKSHVKLAENTTLTNNGTLQIGGVLTGGNGGSNCGFTFGNHAQLTLGTNSKLLSEDGSIVCYGFITEETSNNGSLVKIGNEAGNGTGSIKMPWVMYEHRGGTNTVNLSELSDQAIKDIISTALGGRTSYITGNFKTIPFNRFFLPNVSTTMTVHYGGSVIGLVNMYADEQINQAEIKVIGSTTDCMIQLSANNSKLVAKHNVDTSVTKLDIYGDMAVNPMSMKLYMKTTKAGIDVKAEVTVNTATIFLPISWLYDISLHTVTGQSSATAKFNQDIKILPGGKLTVDSGVNVTANKLIIYDHSWTEDSTLAASVYETTYGTKGRLILNGKLTVNELSGFVETTLNTGELLINTSNTLTAVEAVSKGATRSITYLVVTIDNFSSVNYTTINRGITAYGYMVQNDGSTSDTTNALQAKTTYKSNGSGWYTSTTTSTITYNLVGGTASASINPTLVWKDGLTASNIAAPTRIGYTFDGWYIGDHKVAVGEKYYGAITLVAHWTAKTGTVTYNAQNGTTNTTELVTYDGTYNLPEVTRTGYKFVGWFTAQTGGTNVTLNNKVQTEGNHTLYAQWEAEKYTVTFDSDGGTACESITVTFGSPYGELPTPTKDKHQLEGWYLNGIKIDADTIVETVGPHKLKAVWTEIDSTITVTFIDGDTTTTREYGAGLAYGTLPTPTKTNYTFAGWYTGSIAEDGTISYEERVSASSIAGTTDYNLFAKWEINKYIITFNSNGYGTDPAAQTIDHGSKATNPGALASTTTHDHDGKWYTDSACTTEFNFDTEITKDMELYAKWSIKTFTVTFDTNGHGTAPQTQTIAYGSKVTQPNDLSETGYQFGGWYTDSACTTEFNFDTEITDNMTLYAKWTRIKYTVTYDANDGSVSPTSATVNAGESITTLPTPTRDNHTFNGWYTAASGGTKVNTPYTPTANITLYAQWTEESSGGCIAAGTLITMADGSKKKIELLSNSDMILGFDHETGKLKAVPIAYLDCSAKEILTVIDMVIGDTNVKVINEHGFFDVDLKEYVTININNVDDYLGHRFLKVYIDENGEEQQEIVTFTSYSVYQEETRWYSLVAAFTINHLANDILTISDNLIGLYDYFELDNEFKYDAVQKEQDILTYGLFVYDDWKEYLTIEQFYAFNCHYLKVSVGKGILTEDLIFYYINRYVNHDNAI